MNSINVQSNSLHIVCLGKCQETYFPDLVASQFPGLVVSDICDMDSALPFIQDQRPQAVLLDLDATDHDIPTLVAAINEVDSLLSIIGFTKEKALDTIVNAVRQGVKKVIHFSEASEKLSEEMETLLAEWQERDAGDKLREDLKAQYDFSNIITQSSEMLQVFKVVSKIIRRKWVTVLIRGETGTGKEAIARSIHHNNQQQFKPFVEINCNALPENLLESELFGYEKGAFTDARNRKKGLFELADEGTLFLDEIGDISLKMQAKLLKAIEEKKIRRLGGTTDIQVNTRIISATNRNLQEAIKEKQFREDLYYRLNVISIYLPPLRERGDDVLLLATHFLKFYAKEYDSPLDNFSTEAMSLLKRYHWPGNIRELKHTIERIALLEDGTSVSREALERTIDSDIPLLLSDKSKNGELQITVPSEGLSLDDGEELLIREILKSTSWNKRRTCKILRISRPRLDRKIEKYGLLRPDLSS